MISQAPVRCRPSAYFLAGVFVATVTALVLAALVAAALAKTQKDALMSPAINALQNLSANYSTADTDHTGASKSSVMGQYKIQVNRYFGGTEENEKWTKTLTAQAERGLLVEQLKMKALNLSIATQKYKQYEMMESQLAALVALEVQKGAGQSAKSAANQALSNKITGAN